MGSSNEGPSERSFGRRNIVSRFTPNAPPPGNLRASASHRSRLRHCSIRGPSRTRTPAPARRRRALASRSNRHPQDCPTALPTHDDGTTADAQTCNRTWTLGNASRAKNGPPKQPDDTTTSTVSPEPNRWRARARSTPVSTPADRNHGCCHHGCFLHNDVPLRRPPSTFRNTEMQPPSGTTPSPEPSPEPAMPRPRSRSRPSERPAHSLPGSPPLDGDQRAPASGQQRYTRRHRGADAVASVARPGRRGAPTRGRTITPCRAACNEAGPAPTSPVAAWSSSRRRSHAPPRVWGTTPSPEPSPEPTIPRPRSTSAPSAKPGHLLPGSPPLDGDHRAPPSRRQRYTRRRRGADAVAPAVRPGRRAAPTRGGTITPCRTASKEADPNRPHWSPASPQAAVGRTRRRALGARHRRPIHRRNRRCRGLGRHRDRVQNRSTFFRVRRHLTATNARLRAVDNDTLAAARELTLLHRLPTPRDARRRHAAGRSPHAERRPKRLIPTRTNRSRPGPRAAVGHTCRRAPTTPVPIRYTLASTTDGHPR